MKDGTFWSVFMFFKWPFVCLQILAMTTITTAMINNKFNVTIPRWKSSQAPSGLPKKMKSVQLVDCDGNWVGCQFRYVFVQWYVSTQKHTMSSALHRIHLHLFLSPKSVAPCPVHGYEGQSDDSWQLFEFKCSCLTGCCCWKDVFRRWTGQVDIGLEEEVQVALCALTSPYPEANLGIHPCSEVGLAFTSLQYIISL